MEENKNNLEIAQSIDRIKTICKASLILLLGSIIVFILALVNSPKDKLDLDVIIYGFVIFILLILFVSSLITYFIKKRKKND